MNKKEEKIISLLEATRNEMDELRLELVKEKNEPELQYKALKEQLNISISEIKLLLENNTALGEELKQTLMTKLSELQLELETPKESLIVNFKEHLSNVRKNLIDLIAGFEKQSPRNETIEHIRNSLNRFRIKFEILKLKFALGKMDLKDATSNAKHKTSRKIMALRRFIHENEEVARKNWKNFRQEINEAYSDLQKSLH